MFIEIIMALISAFTVVCFWRTLLFLLLGAVAFLMALGLVTIAEWIMH